MFLLVLILVKLIVRNRLGFVFLGVEQNAVVDISHSLCLGVTVGYPIALVPQGRCEIKERALDSKSGNLGCLGLRRFLWLTQNVSVGKLFKPSQHLLPYL